MAFEFSGTAHTNSRIDAETGISPSVLRARKAVNVRVVLPVVERCGCHDHLDEQDRRGDTDVGVPS